MSKKIVCGFIAVLLFVIALNVPVFEIINEKANIDNVYDRYSKYDVFTLNYTYTTGAGWIVNECNNPNYVGQYVILECPFDPRLLNINKDYSMDIFSSIVVISSKCKKVIYDNKNTNVIKAKKIYIYLTSESEYKHIAKKFYIYDLRPVGILKALIGVLFPYFRWSI